MNICPNCFKKLNENFTYCNKCGSRVDEECRENLKTNFLNVFKRDSGFIYIFAVHGRQVVLNGDTIEELRELVRLNRFPWMELEANLLDTEVSLTESKNENYAIINLSTLERNPEYSNLDKMFK